MATMGQVQKQASYWIFASGKLAPKNQYQNAEKQKRNSSSSSRSSSSSSISIQNGQVFPNKYVHSPNLT